MHRKGAFMCLDCSLEKRRGAWIGRDARRKHWKTLNARRKHWKTLNARRKRWKTLNARRKRRARIFVRKKNMEKILIGKIVNAVALKGEVKVYNYSGFPERYGELERIIAGGKEYEIEKVRYQQAMVILKLKGVDDRNAAEAMRGKEVFITEDDLAELPEDTFYIRDLIGLNVVDDETGAVIGTLKDVLQNTAQDIYIVKRESGSDILIPAVAQFVKRIDPKGGEIRVSLIEGMAE